MSEQYTREDLLAICERAFSLEENWYNRDSSDAIRQLGECYALLRAGCGYRVLRGGSLKTDARAIWLEVTYKGFAHFEYGGNPDDQTYYLPTIAKLEAAGKQRDWY